MIKNVSLEVTAIHFQNFGSIVYLLQLPNNNILIDTSSKENSEELIHELKILDIKPKDISIIFLTHAHYDHTQNIDSFPNAKIYGNFTEIINQNHTQTKEPRIQPISNFQIQNSNFQFIPAPGHTPGDILILYKNILFSGDVVFHNGYIGRNDLPESNIKDQQKSLQMLSKLKFSKLCPGH